MVAGLHCRDAGADLAHDPGPFMSEDRRKQAFRIGTREGVGVGMADAGRHDLDEHLAGLRSVDRYRLYGQGLPRRPGDGCANVHQIPPICTENRD